MRSVTAIGLVCAVYVSPVAAQSNLIDPVAQMRSVSGEANADNLHIFLNDADSDQASDFGPFVSSVSARIDEPECLATAGGSQDSEILPESIRAEGSTFSNSEVYEFLWLAEGSGISLMVVDFDLSVKAQFHLSGLMEAFDSAYSVTELRDGNGSVVFGRNVLGPSGSEVIDAAGILDPGSYTFLCTSRADTLVEIQGRFDYGFATFDMLLQVSRLSDNYCVAAGNSAGPDGALLSFSGSQNITTNDFHLDVIGAPPGESGLFYYGRDAVQAPFGDGFRCVGGPVYRLLPPVTSDGSGSASRQVDFTVPPAGGGGPGTILPTSTWNFQYWYRDPMGAGSGFNLSDGLWVTFCP